MVTRLTHASLFVLDHQTALDFYVDALGFSVTMDFAMPNGFRWLTLCAPKQPDVSIVLIKVESGDASPMSDITANSLKEILTNAKLGMGVFECDDCKATYEELSSKGVKFSKEPTNEFYGVEAVFEDPFGNWFSMVQRK